MGGFNLFEESIKDVLAHDQVKIDKMQGWQKTFNSETMKGRKNVVLATLGFYVGIYAIMKVTKKKPE